MAGESLTAWQEKNHPWLQLSNVHRETTEQVRVTAIPFYMGCRVGMLAVPGFGLLVIGGSYQCHLHGVGCFV